MNENPKDQNCDVPLPGVCIPWEEAKKRYGQIQGDEEQIKRIWETNDAEAYDYYWQCLLSF